MGVFDHVTYNGKRISETEAVTIATEFAKRKTSSVPS